MQKRDLYYERIPTKLLRENVRYLGNILGKVIKEQELSLANNGRVIVRESGTEPIIRVMVESKEEAVINDICENIVSSIEKSVNKNN